MNDETLEQLETRIAFLERANSELSDVVFQQHRDIESLRAQLLMLAERIEVSHAEPMRTPEEERPPHY